MQTICPHCQTVFKVSDEHLKAAEGYVRCGICKEVFNALETDLPAAKIEPVAQTEISSTAETPVEKIIEPDNTGPVDFILQQSDAVSTNDDMDSLPASEVISDKKEETPAIEIASPDNIQTDLFSGSSETSKPEPKPVNSDIAQAEEITPEEIKPEAVKPEASAVNTPATEIESESTAEPAEKIEDHNETNSTTDDIVDNIPEPTIVIAATTAPISSAPVTNSYSNNSNMDNSLFDGVQSKLIPDEYRIPELHNTYSLWQDITWSMAILVLTASLFVEYTWFNRNELISNPQLRPLVAQFCLIANCDTMDLRELGEIEMTTRNIYSHPNVKNALMISGSLVNHAQFEQPYPNILIDFSDVRGEVIASRIFTPEDYLQIKAGSLKPMEPRMSIDFNMEIQDPGKNAMTYEFSFL